MNIWEESKIKEMVRDFLPSCDITNLSRCCRKRLISNQLIAKLTRHLQVSLVSGLQAVFLTAIIIHLTSK